MIPETEDELTGMLLIGPDGVDETEEPVPVRPETVVVFPYGADDDSV